MKLSRIKLHEFIKAEVPFWCTKLNVAVPTITHGKTSDGALMWVGRYSGSSTNFYLEYNVARIQKECKTYDEVLFVVLHELGHIFHRALVEYMDEDDAEYIAERFALRNFKRHFNKERYETIVKKMATEWVNWKPKTKREKDALTWIEEYKPYKPEDATGVQDSSR